MSIPILTCELKMRLLSLLTCLSLTALAPAAYAQDPSGEATDEDIDPVIDPVVVVPLGEAPAAPTSIWDHIEGGRAEPITPEEEVASKELAEERFAEQAALTAEAIFHLPDLGLYLNPFQALEVDPLHLDKLAPGEFDIPIVTNAHVERWMRYFLGSGRKWFGKWLSRKPAFEPMIYAEMERQKLPKDLIYVSMVESGFSVNARSWAEAVGLWQFISPTAKGYGLRVDYWVDDRRDPELATAAAAALLKDLKSHFGDWYLAWAGYNCAPSRISKAAKTHNTRNFWVLYETGSIPEETRNYVPKVLAAAIIGKHPERYGFTGIKGDAPPKYDTAIVDGAYGMDVLAKCAGVSQEELQALNPSILRGATPPDSKHGLRIPVGSKERFVEALAKVPESDRLTFQKHTVAKGETMSKIAARYGVSTDALASYNRISNPNMVAVGTVLLIPRSGTSAPPPEALTASASKSSSSKPSTTKSTTTTSKPTARTHTVAKGETLSTIADRYDVSTSDLQDWNNLKSANNIQAGQKLTVMTSGSASSSSTAKAAAPKAPTTYTVKKGDTLSDIAERHDVSVSSLVSANGLKSASAIYPGQVLKLSGSGAAAKPVETVQWKTYTVKKGDSLGAIASAHGVTVTELKSWNNLKSSTIQPGQKLKVQVD